MKVCCLCTWAAYTISKIPQCTQQMIATNSGGGGEANGDELVSNEANEDATSMHTQWAAVES